MSDNQIHAVNLPDDAVIKGSNFPTPMAMAPQAEDPKEPDSKDQDGSEE